MRTGRRQGEHLRRIERYSLWQGHAGDARDLGRLGDIAIEALVDLAAEEPAVAVPRGMTYLRFPLCDGAGNPGWVIRAAVRSLTELLRAGVPTLVCCSAGQSRSPAVIAAALALTGRGSAEECLALTGAGNVTPAFWAEVAASCRGDTIPPEER